MQKFVGVFAKKYVVERYRDEIELRRGITVTSHGIVLFAKSKEEFDALSEQRGWNKRVESLYTQSQRPEDLGIIFYEFVKTVVYLAPESYVGNPEEPMQSGVVVYTQYITS